MDSSIFLALCGLLLSAATFFIGRTTAAKQTGLLDGEMKSDIKHIKNSVEKQERKLDEVVESYDDVKLEIERLKGRLKALEQKVEMLHSVDA